MKLNDVKVFFAASSNVAAWVVTSLTTHASALLSGLLTICQIAVAITTAFYIITKTKNLRKQRQEESNNDFTNF